jgi:hypothetical protein
VPSKLNGSLRILNNTLMLGRLVTMYHSEEQREGTLIHANRVSVTPIFSLNLVGAHLRILNKHQLHGPIPDPPNFSALSKQDLLNVAKG